MDSITKTLYDTDFVEWSERTARLLRAGRFAELDLGRVAEEIEDLGKRERSAVGHHLQRMLMHLLKRRVQPERSDARWRRSIHESRSRIQYKLDDSPSLRSFLESILPKAYRRAVRDAASETGVPAERMPADCPWTLHDLLEGEPE